MKDDSVVIPFPSQSCKVLHRLPYLLGIQLESNVPLGRMDHSSCAQLRSQYDSSRRSGRKFLSRRSFVEDISVGRPLAKLSSVLRKIKMPTYSGESFVKRKNRGRLNAVQKRVGSRISFCDKSGLSDVAIACRPLSV